MDIPIAANVLGTLGAVCWSIQLLPQIIINYRRHDTTGLQPTMMLLWATAGVPLGVYNITQSFNLALQIQPQILTTLSLVTWAQCKYYGQDTRWSVGKCGLAVVAIGVVMGGVEGGLVVGLQGAVARGHEWAAKVVAVVAAVLLSAGVGRHYWDIYKERTVRGISFLFVGIDAMGDLTSLVAVLCQREVDVLGLVVYGSELVLWLGVFACGGWYNLRPWVRRVRGEKRRGGDGNGQASVVEEEGSVGGQGGQGETGDEDRMSLSSTSSSVFRTASNSLGAHEVRLRNLGRV